jgi:hypothetical protein
MAGLHLHHAGGEAGNGAAGMAAMPGTLSPTRALGELLQRRAAHGRICTAGCIVARLRRFHPLRASEQHPASAPRGPGTVQTRRRPALASAEALERTGPRTTLGRQDRHGPVWLQVGAGFLFPARSTACHFPGASSRAAPEREALSVAGPVARTARGLCEAGPEVPWSCVPSGRGCWHDV